MDVGAGWGIAERKKRGGGSGVALIGHLGGGGVGGRGWM